MGPGGGVYPCMSAIVGEHAVLCGVLVIGEIAAGYYKCIAYTRTVATYGNGVGAGTFFSLYNGDQAAAGIIV